MAYESTIAVFDRSDFSTELHPRIWEGLCEDLGAPPETETVTVRMTLLSAD